MPYSRQSIMQGEIGNKIIPVTTKKFKKIVKRYFKLSKVFVYRFIKPDKTVIYIHIYFMGKLRTDVVEEIKSYVHMGVYFIFKHVSFFNFIYSKEYGLFFKKKKVMTEKGCIAEREQISKAIEQENKVHGSKEKSKSKRKKSKRSVKLKTNKK